MNKEEMQSFLETQGITVVNVEGDDFSAVFHVSNEDRKKVEQNLKEYEEKTGVNFAASDMYGMSVVIMENDEE